MTEIDPAVAAGGLILGERVHQLTGEFAYEETAYHLPISYAMTGKAVHDAETGKEVFELSGRSPLVAVELLAAKAARMGKEPDPYTGFIGDAVIRKLGYSLVDGSILGPILAKLHDGFVAALNAPAVKEHLAKLGAVPIGSTPEEFDRAIRAEAEKWAPIIRAAGIRAE